MKPRVESRSHSGSEVTPREAAERLEIPPSTLRTYAVEFGSLLSGGAQTVEGDARRSFRHRRYTNVDLAILQEAKGLLGMGLTFRLALAELARGRPGQSGEGEPSIKMTPRSVRRRPRPQPRHAELAPERAENAPSSPPPFTVPPPPREPRAPLEAGGALELESRELIEALARRLERIDRQLDDNRFALAALVDLVDQLRVALGESSRLPVRETPPTPVRRSCILGLFRRSSDR